MWCAEVIFDVAQRGDLHYYLEYFRFRIYLEIGPTPSVPSSQGNVLNKKVEIVVEASLKHSNRLSLLFSSFDLKVFLVNYFRLTFPKKFSSLFPFFF